MSSLRRGVLYALAFFAFLVAIFSSVPRAWGIGFQPVSPDELKMTGNAKAPGAPAIILFREVDRDDRGQTAHEDVYFRIKILTAEGRKYADIEIPFYKQVGSVINVHARTIEPDGTIVNFSGKAFDKSIVKARGVKYLAKTFTMPDVRVGSILEYYYTTDLAENFVFDSHWILNHELYTMRAKFTLNPYNSDNPPMYLRWVWHDLPVGATQPKEGPDHVVSLEVADVPAFQTEDYMPPENELKSRVDFIYSEDQFEDQPDKYWTKFGKKRNNLLESFLGKRKSLEEALSSIVSPTDPQEVKLQKIYARVQQIRNTSFEAEKTEQEQKRNKEKTPTTAQDVWKKQYGYGGELTWLFLGLARAAGFEASGVWVADRQNYFFSPQTMDGGRLDQNVVLVKLNGKDMYFDPGSAFIPFGMLPWFETGVKGLKLDKDGGSWVQTTVPESSESTIHRKAELTLSGTGDLEGKLTLTFTGLEASQRRTEERLTDDADRKKYLEDEVKGSIPAACDVDLTNSPDWKSSTPSLVAEFKIKIPGWASAAGHRALMPVGLFSAPEKHLFDHADRVHPVYFEFPFERIDEVNINLPLGWQIATVPAPQKLDAKALTYDLEAQNNKGTLHLNRVLNVDLLLLPKENYPNLRKIFQIVRSSDEQQVMLQPGAATASN
ncbi:MAG: cyclic lactone autoinducer peptide [Candidatus Sulfotelmatobacter sp.]